MGVIRALEQVVPPDPDKPVRPETAQSQRWSRQIARDPSVWSTEAARQIISRYTELAPVWDGERGAYRSVPLDD